MSSQDLAEFWKKVLGHGPSEKWKKMIRTNKYTNKYADDTKLNLGVNPNNREDVNFEIETEIPGSRFKRLIQDLIKL